MENIQSAFNTKNFKFGQLFLELENLEKYGLCKTENNEDSKTQRFDVIVKK